jgi:hypothetical protein
MTFKERVASWFRAGMPDDFEPEVSGVGPVGMVGAAPTGSIEGATPLVRLDGHVPPAAAPPAPSQESPQVSNLDSADEVARLRAEVKALRDRRKADISAGARAFAEGDPRVAPAEAPFLAFVYAQLAAADEEQTHPEGGFRVEGHPEPFETRVEVLRHAVSLRGDLSRSQERVVDDATLAGLKVVDNGSAGKDEAAAAYELGRSYGARANRRA